jgi:hypothetical protein
LIGDIPAFPTTAAATNRPSIKSITQFILDLLKFQ